MVDDVEYPNRIPTPSAGAGAGVSSSSRVLDQLQSWLSPPDPSMNHNLARGPFRMRTGRWFLQDSTFKKWKSTGSSSLLWIHGKRISVLLSAFTACLLTGSRYHSGLGQKRPLVRFPKLLLLKGTDISAQFRNYRGHRSRAQSSIGLYGLFLFRLQRHS